MKLKWYSAVIISSHSDLFVVPLKNNEGVFKKAAELYLSTSFYF